MKAVNLIIIILLSVLNVLYGQNREKYFTLIQEAWSLYENKAYLKAGQKYTEAFVANGDKGMANDRYNAACSWALAGEAESAFIELFKIAKSSNYTNYSHITTDPDLKSLYSDSRWQEVLAIVKANKEKEEANFDKSLVAILDTIYQKDQQYRKQIDEIEKKYGWESNEMKAHWKIIQEKDSINLIKVRKILDERGWLGPSVIGGQGNSTLFLVIQHSDLQTQEKYLPMMREAVKKGNANPSSLALLEDRVALGNGKRQIYGSQIGRNEQTKAYYVLPLEDPDNVDKRREEVGLEPLQNYISHWGMTWDVEVYKKQLLEIEHKQKR